MVLEDGALALWGERAARALDLLRKASFRRVGGVGLADRVGAVVVPSRG